MFHTHSLSPTDQKCAESSTYWQFFYYCPPGKFRFTHLGEIVKMLWQELDIYIYIYISSTWDWLHHFSVSFHEKFEKKMFFKIIKSWQVCDWLAKWIIMLQFMDLRWPRVFQRSNVGLVVKCFRDVLMYVLERYIKKIVIIYNIAK